MDEIAAEYPHLVSKYQIGETYEKRPLYILKVLFVLRIRAKLCKKV